MFHVATFLKHETVCAHPYGAEQCPYEKSQPWLSTMAGFQEMLSRGSGGSEGGRTQWADAAAAPMPVSERTSCASKPALSIAARGLLSVTEKNQMPKKPTAIEKIAGEV